MVTDQLQYFLEHFWTDQQCDQIWTLGPRIYYQKTSQKYKTNMGRSLNHIISISENLNFWKDWKVCVPILNFWNYKTWKFGICKLKFGNSNLATLKIGNLNIGNLFRRVEIRKLWNFQILHREVMKTPLTILQNIVYEFFISIKSMKWTFGIYYISSFFE